VTASLTHNFGVVPGTTTRSVVIPGLRLAAHPGMTAERVNRHLGDRSLSAGGDRHGPHRIAFAEYRAGARDHVIAFIDAVADFDLAP
jgi:hypothetical protein